MIESDNSSSYKSRILAVKREAAEYLLMYHTNNRELAKILGDVMYSANSGDNWRRSGGGHSDPTAARAIKGISSGKVKDLKRSIAVVDKTIAELRNSQLLDSYRRLQLIKLYYLGTCQTLQEAYMRLGLSRATGERCNDRLLLQVARIAGIDTGTSPKMPSDKK